MEKELEMERWILGEWACTEAAAAIDCGQRFVIVSVIYGASVSSVIICQRFGNLFQCKARIPLVSRHDSLSSPCILVQENVIRALSRMLYSKRDTARRAQQARHVRHHVRDRRDTQLSL